MQKAFLKLLVHSTNSDTCSAKKTDRKFRWEVTRNVVQNSKMHLGTRWTVGTTIHLHTVFRLNFFFDVQMRTVFRVTHESFVLSVTHLGSFVFLSLDRPLTPPCSRRSKTTAAKLACLQYCKASTTKKKHLQRHNLLCCLASLDLSSKEAKYTNKCSAMTTTTKIDRRSTATTESRCNSGRVPRRASAPTIINADFGDISPGSSLSDESDDDNTFYYYYRPTTKHEAPKFVRRKSSSANYLEEEVVLPSRREKDVPREKKNDKEDHQISLLQQMSFEREEADQQRTEDQSPILTHKVDGKTKKTRRRSSGGLDRSTHTYDSSRLEEELLMIEEMDSTKERRKSNGSRYARRRSTGIDGSNRTGETESIHSDDDLSELDEDQLLLLALAKKMEDKKPERRKSNGLDKSTQTCDSTKLKDELLMLEEMDSAYSRRKSNGSRYARRRSTGIDGSSRTGESQKSIGSYSRRRSTGLDGSSSTGKSRKSASSYSRRRSTGMNGSTHTYDSSRLEEELLMLEREQHKSQKSIGSYSRRKSTGLDGSSRTEKSRKSTGSYSRRRSTGLDGNSRTEEGRKSASSYSRRRSTGMTESSHSTKSSGLDANNRTHDSSRLEEELLVLEKLEEERVQKLLEQMDMERKKKDKKQMRRSSFSETLSTIFPKDKGQRPKSYKDPEELESLPRIKSSF